MKYTFLLPAYKAPFLREALASILAQTYTDFRVIVSDDCSPENLKSIVDEFADDERLTYRRNPVNIGAEHLTDHWNMLVDLCQTEWLILASDDDVYHPRFLEEIDRLQRKYPEVDLIRARAQFINKKGEVTRRDALYEEFVTQVEFILQYFYPIHTECIANHAFRTQVLRSIGGFVNMPMAWTSDTATTWAMARNGAANTRDTLFSFRLSGENISCRGLVFDKTETNKLHGGQPTDITIMRLKLQAGIMFGDYSRKLISSIDCGDDMIQCGLLNIIRRRHAPLVCGMTFSYAIYLRLIDFIRFVVYIRKCGYIRGVYPTYKLCKKWLWHKMHKHR